MISYTRLEDNKGSQNQPQEDAQETLLSKEIEKDLVALEKVDIGNLTNILPTSEPSSQSQSSTPTVQSQTSESSLKTVEAQKLSIVHQREELMKREEVRALARTVDINKNETILHFGSMPAQKMQLISDKMIKNMEGDKIQDAEKLIKSLDNIMDKVDLPEIIEKAQKESLKKPNIFKRLLSSPSLTIQELASKYKSVTDELQTVTSELKKFEVNLTKGSNTLLQLMKASILYYYEIENYIAAGFVGLNEVNSRIEALEKRYEETQDQMLPVQIGRYKKSAELLDKRIHDLETSQSLILATIPVIQIGIETNTELIRSIDASCTTTIPSFKQGIVMAMSMKQSVHAGRALAIVQDRSNKQIELLAKGAKMSAEIQAEASKSTAINVESICKLQEAVKESRNIMAKAAKESREIREKNRAKILEMKANWQIEEMNYLENHPEARTGLNLLQGADGEPDFLKQLEQIN